MPSYNGFDNTAFVNADSSPFAPDINPLLIGFSWTGTVGKAATNITYAFTGNPDSTFVNDMNYALGTWAHVANVHFTNITGKSGAANAQITLVEDTSLLSQGELGVTYPTTNNAGNQLVQAEVHVDPNDPDKPAGNPQADVLLTMVHELGHALGFKHPENYGGDADGLGPFLPASEGNNDFTLMAYDYGKYATMSDPAVTPMPFDILAMQYLYGANTSVQNVTVNITGALTTQTVWSAGGVNTFNGQSYSGNEALDLRQGDVSVAGQSNYFIAYGTNIQVAYAGAGNNTIALNNAGDYVNAGPGNDTVTGAGGNDTIYAAKGDDIITGGSGGGYINGNIGNDTIIANGASVLHGGQGNDSIHGSAGNDIIYGDLGNNTMTGGSGADIFVFNNSAGALGQNLITDFNPAQDKLEFNSAIFASSAAAMAAIDSSGVIHMPDGGTVTLANITPAQLNINDFMIVG